VCSAVVNRSTLAMLRRKRAEFHGAGRFTRYRYPVKFHQSSTNASDRAPAVHAHSLLPASLRSSTRYSQEPTVQSSGPRRRVAAVTKSRHGTRQTVDRACQCSMRVVSVDSCCQAGSGATTHVDRAVSTAQPTYHDAVVMTTRVETMTRMTETDLRLVELPTIDHLTSNLTLDAGHAS